MGLAALTGNRPLDCSYHAAFYLLSQEPELFETARKCVTVDGIEFAKIKRLTKGFDETSRQIIDLAHNLFSWTSKCKVTPFDISRLYGAGVQCHFHCVRRGSGADTGSRKWGA